MRRTALALIAIIGLLLGANAANATAAAHPGVSMTGVSPAVHGTSNNWVGYYADGTFKAATLSWVQPAVDCATAPDGEMGFEVGLDGAHNGVAEQVGTIAICTDGTPAYYDWWLMYPATPDIQIVHPVAAGDVLDTSVSANHGRFTLTVTDVTDPSQSFTVKRTCNECPGESVEWLGDRQFDTFAMPDFGAVRLRHGTATDGNGHTGPIAAWGPFNLFMINGNHQVLARASRLLYPNGSAFKVRWLAPQ
jgi:Peptidase A4 family